MNYIDFHDKFMRNIEPLGILSVCLQNEWQNIVFAILWFPAEFYANLANKKANESFLKIVIYFKLEKYLGKFDLSSIANHSIFVNFISRIVDKL